MLGRSMFRRSADDNTVIDFDRLQEKLTALQQQALAEQQMDFIEFVKAAYHKDLFAVNTYLAANKPKHLPTLQVDTLLAGNIEGGLAELYKIFKWTTLLIYVAAAAGYSDVSKTILTPLDIDVNNPVAVSNTLVYGRALSLRACQNIGKKLNIDDDIDSQCSTISDVFKKEWPATDENSLREYYNARFLTNRSDNDFQNAVDNNNVKFIQDYINKNNLATLTPERRNEVITLFSKALKKAAFYGHTGIVKALLDAGVDPNTTDKRKTPALIAAANNGHADTVNVLLTAKDINVNITHGDNSRETALMCASRNGYATIVKALLAAGASVDLTNQYNETALICAITECKRANRDKENFSYIECIHALLATPGINLSIAKYQPYSNENGTALFVAIKHHRPGAVKELIAAGADVNAIDLFSGYTPLSLAAVYAASQIWTNAGGTPWPESVDTFQALLTAPTLDLEAKNGVGRTALEELYIPRTCNPLTYPDMIAAMLRDSISSKEKSKSTPLASTTLSHGFFAREQNPHQPSGSTLETALDNTTTLPRLV